MFSILLEVLEKLKINHANSTTFANLEIECEEKGEEKNDVRMSSSPPRPMNFEVRYLNFFFFEE